MFLQESFKSSVPEGFFHTSSRQPLRPYTRHQLSLWFSMGLRARNRTGHVIMYHQPDGTLTNDWMAEEGGGVTTEMGSQSVTHFMQLKRYVGTT